MQYKGKEILRLDFSGCGAQEIINFIEEVKTVVRSHPENSLLTLVNLSNINFTSEMIENFKGLLSYNKPYVRVGAFFGLTRFQKAVINTYIMFLERNVAVVDTEEEAKEYLVN